MKILIAGTGAVGTFVGGKLAASGLEIILFSRHREVCEAIAQHGLVCRDQNGEQRAKARGYSDLRQLFAEEEGVSLAILAVKSFSTRAILLSLAPYLHRIDFFLTLGNGLGNEETLFDYVDLSKIIAGACTTACTLEEPGAAKAENRGGVALAPVSARASIANIARAFREARFEVKVCSDWRSMKWSKLLLNIMANATCAILDMSAAEIYENPRTFAIERRLFLEAVSVMEAHKLKPVALPGQPIPLYVWGTKHLPAGLLKRIFRGKMKAGRGGKPASLHLDFLKGKKETEWPFLYGVLLEKAREKSLRAPVLETLCALLSGITTGKIPWEKYRRNPKALSDAILETLRHGGT